MSAIITFPKDKSQIQELLQFLKKTGIKHKSLPNKDSIENEILEGISDYKDGKGQKMTLSEFLAECK